MHKVRSGGRTKQPNAQGSERRKDGANHAQGSEERKDGAIHAQGSEQRKDGDFR